MAGTTGMAGGGRGPGPGFPGPGSSPGSDGRRVPFDHFIPVEAMPVVMNRCRKAKTTVTGSRVTTVMAST